MSLKTIPLIKFLDTNKINYFPINIAFGNNKKPPAPYADGTMPKYTDFKNNPHLVEERKRDIDNYEYIWIDTSTVHQFDIDKEDYKLKDSENFSYYKSVSKGLPHFFVPMSETAKFLKKVAYNLKGGFGEILCGQGAYAKIDSVVYNPKLFKKYVLTPEELEDYMEKPSLPPNPQVKIDKLSNGLNDLFETTGEWNFEDVDDKYCRLCPKNNECLYNKGHFHTSKKCCIIFIEKIWSVSY